MQHICDTNKYGRVFCADQRKSNQDRFWSCLKSNKLSGRPGDPTKKIGIKVGRAAIVTMVIDYVNSAKVGIAWDMVSSAESRTISDKKV